MYHQIEDVPSQIQQNQQTLSPTLIVFGLTNGMIGSLLIILPLHAFRAGYISSVIIILATGLFSYFSCYLYLQHLAAEPENGFSFQMHFGSCKKIIKKIYDSFVIIFQTLINIQYFQFMVWSWKDIAPQVKPEWMYPFVNALILLVSVFTVKYIYVKSTLMGYGIFSIAVYIVFLFWVLGSSNPQKQYQQYKIFSDNPYCGISLTAAMIQGYVIQIFLVPILRKSKEQKQYTQYIRWTYLIGGIVYFSIAYLGSFGILYRQNSHGPRNGKFNTILDYFGDSEWPVIFIEVVYILHLYSVYPEFLLISKRKLFDDILELPSTFSPKCRNVMSVIYYFVYVGITVACYNISVNIRVINGAIFGFFIVYLFPSILHLQCINRKLSSSFISSDKNQNNENVIVEKKQKNNGGIQKKLICHCESTKNKRWWICLICLMLVFGGSVMVLGIIVTINDSCPL